MSAQGPRDSIPSTRLARGAMLGGFVAEQTARYAGTAVANAGRGRRRRRIAIEQRHLDAADQILSVLGTMKGPAMKLGQILSFVDLRIIPEEVRPRFQQRLARLCVEAPPIAWHRMEPVLVDVLGGRITRFFSEFDTDPIGSASIGQVYRATTRDGVDVAVKAQYPDMAAAARADAKNLSVLLRIGKSLAPSIDTTKLGAELTGRLLEELDYTREAQNTRTMAEVYRGHPFIRIPAPVLDLCRPTLLVTEYLEGRDFDAVCADDEDVRRRVGEALARFYLGSMCRLAMFSGDPHPGNVRLLDDGRVAVLDFGSFRRLDGPLASTLNNLLGSALHGRTEDLLTGLAETEVLARADALTPAILEELLSDGFGWFLEDRPVTMDPHMASEAILLSVARTGPYATVLSGQDLPVEWTMMARALVTTSALLGQLRATANWNRIAREWACGDPPSTELGVAEAAFFDGVSA